ncbi:MAG: glycosyltransferase family 4 protein [Microbacteriaceae bacterium]
MTGRRLVIVVRADPVICGHSVEARNLAEAALTRGFDDVRIVTWPLERLEASGLPLKPLDRVLPYSAGIVVERPAPVGDYKVVDARYYSGLVGRLVELFTDGVPTTCISLYLSPHTLAVAEAVRTARATGLPVAVTTIAEAVGSDVTNVVRSCVATGAMGAAAQILASYLEQDRLVAVSEYTRELIVASATELDAAAGTRFAPQLAERVTVSYPAIDTSAYLDLDEAALSRALAARGLERDGYVLFLSRLMDAKGVDDLIEGFARARSTAGIRLVIAGRGPSERALRERAAASVAAERILFLTDVSDDEKPYLMAGCAAYALPTKPRPEFVETFGIALVEKMLAGGGPVITTDTGGVLEAVGDTATIVPADDPDAIAAALDDALTLDAASLRERERAARAFALRFDRAAVFDRLLAPR